MNDVCCYDSGTQGTDCTDASNCQGNGTSQFPTAISCQFPSQCESGICCGTRYFDNGQLPYETTACADACESPSRFLCDPQHPSCPDFTNMQGQQQMMFCKASTILPPGYFICSTTP